MNRGAGRAVTSAAAAVDPRTARAMERVAYENACAAMIQPEDIRWIFALRVSNTLEGGKAAILTPPKRRELVAAAVGDGMRAFDANLIIAIVQDAARRGELGERAKAVHSMGSSLAMVGGGTPIGSRSHRLRNAIIVAATALVSIGCFALMVRWLVRG